MKAILVGLIFFLSSMLSASEQASSALFLQFSKDRALLEPLHASKTSGQYIVCRLPELFSSEHRADIISLHEKYLAKAQKTAARATGSVLLNLESFVFQREQDLASLKSNEHLYSIQTYQYFLKLFALLSSGQGSQPFVKLKDYENWFKCMEQLPSITERIIGVLEEGRKQSLNSAHFIVEDAIKHLNQFQSTAVENSVFYRPVIKLPKHFSARNKQYLIQRSRKIIQTQVMPSFQSVSDYLKNTYLKSASENIGLSNIVNKNEYRRKIAEESSTRKIPEQLHALALQEVEKIKTRLLEKVADNESIGSIEQLQTYLAESPRFKFTSLSKAQAEFDDARLRISKLAPKVTRLFPRSTYKIQVKPGLLTQPKVYYHKINENNYSYGMVTVNADRLEEIRRWEVIASLLREGIPGKHLQQSLQSEFGQLAKFRKEQNNTSYIEGWGLYAESLGVELNLYNKEFDEYGFLVRNLLFSTFAAVDTGIHSEDWSYVTAREFLKSHLDLDERQVEAIIRQIVVSPGHFSAPKIGELMFRSLRAQAESQLGKRFKLNDFHSELLRGGALPLEVLQKQIGRWLASKP